MNENELRAEIDRLTKLNNGLSRQVLAMVDTMESGRRELLATGWDACAKLPTRPNLKDNPYRKPVPDFSGGVLACKVRDES